MGAVFPGRTYRVRADYDELERTLVPRMSEFGVTRLADTTGLDRIGIPTASVVRPGTSDVIWVYSGKGLTRSQARVVAVMEALERTSALWPSSDRLDIQVSTAVGLSRSSRGPVWGAARFTEARCESAEPIPWVAAERLPDGEPVWVPADLVFAGRRPADLVRASLFPARTSNGLAAGFDVDGATLHALLEIAERDIVSHFEVLSSHAGVSYLAAIAEQVGIDVRWLGDVYRDDTEMAVTVEQASLPPVARRLVGRFVDAGLAVVVKALPNDLRLPTFGAACTEEIGISEVLGCAGYSARFDPEEAVVAALLELAQTRATDLQGAREDRHDIEKQRLPRSPASHWLLTSGSPLPFFAVRALFDEVDEPSVDGLLGRLGAVGLTDAAVFQFDAPPGVSAVRVLVPGAETWHCTGGEASLGPRLGERVNRG